MYVLTVLWCVSRENLKPYLDEENVVARKPTRKRRLPYCIKKKRKNNDSAVSIIKLKRIRVSFACVPSISHQRELQSSSHSSHIPTHTSHHRRVPNASSSTGPTFSPTTGVSDIFTLSPLTSLESLSLESALEAGPKGVIRKRKRKEDELQSEVGKRDQERERKGEEEEEWSSFGGFSDSCGSDDELECDGNLNLKALGNDKDGNDELELVDVSPASVDLHVDADGSNPTDDSEFTLAQPTNTTYTTQECNLSNRDFRVDQLE